MGTLRVIRPGLFTTVQDLGRPGRSSDGIVECGAADEISLIVANRLVGNDDNAAALEITLFGGDSAFDDDRVVAVCGGVASVTLAERDVPARSVPMWRALRVPAGATLSVGPVTRGARTYLAVAGGVATPRVLGARATHAPSGIGGHAGRALTPGDALPIGDAQGTNAGIVESEAVRRIEHAIFRDALRVTDGAHSDDLHAGVRRAFFETAFTVSAKSDRAGTRLEGATLPPRAGGAMISEPMPRGAVQLPDSGLPIILGPDRPSTGGYPVIACVCSADLPAAGQLRPGQRVRFQRIEVAKALEAYRELLRAIDQAVTPR